MLLYIYDASLFTVVFHPHIEVLETISPEVSGLMGFVCRQ